jgi:hypothetical protein
MMTEDNDNNQKGKEQIAYDFAVCNASTVFLNPWNIILFLGDGVMNLRTQGDDPACATD